MRRGSPSLTVSWPTSQTTQTFRDVAADQAIEITEESPSFRVLHQRPVAAERPLARHTQFNPEPSSSKIQASAVEH